LSPTQRSLVYLRSIGYTAAVVERFNQHAGVRQDLFGFVDVLAMRADKQGVLGIQATTASNASKRVGKILSLAAALVWLACGNRIEVWAWRKKKRHWIVDRRVINKESFVEPQQDPQA
jgi:hypothetical protein